MPDVPSHNSPALSALNRLNSKFDEQESQINDFMGRQAQGENPDPAMFSKLLEQRSVTRQAMQAQFKLYEKPLKTVMTETK
ncbi:hypothetical protein [Collimonas humicola]|uniref:hypothetical protein n=1 Tax=Collimonas humicola TaxID=2825886 RepID=UPI001B8B8949|nr:hypothetical protein [Collimonas humicola]